MFETKYSIGELIEWRYVSGICSGRIEEIFIKITKQKYEVSYIVDMGKGKYMIVDERSASSPKTKDDENK